ncbi:TMEM165/GDT1 family protein [Pelotomaculum propionicicum]|uniref:TMEM165/GDT1 family protein n=1 Tax=Pelotomaculum propionicicum TaxID=258475 RepID=UPI003B816944
MFGMEWLTWITTFTLIILCELGDKTQVAVLLLASNNPARRWLIMAASAIALTACVLLEVTVGALIARHISPGMINKGTGVVFLLIGVITLAGQAGQVRKERVKKLGSQQQDLSVFKSCEEKV